MNLIDRLVQLGEEKPHLQEHLRPILDDLLGRQKDEARNWYEEKEESEIPEKPGHGNDPTHDPEDEDFFVSPKARQAFESVLLPEIKSRLEDRSFDKVHQMMSGIEALGTNQNIELENALIVFKPVSMNTDRFYTEVQEAFRDWLVPRLKGTGGNQLPEEIGGGGGKQYNFTFK